MKSIWKRTFYLWNNNQNILKKSYIYSSIDSYSYISIFLLFYSINISYIFLFTPKQNSQWDGVTCERNWTHDQRQEYKTIQILQQRDKQPKNRTSLKPYESVKEFNYLRTIIDNWDVITPDLKALRKRTGIWCKPFIDYFCQDEICNLVGHRAAKGWQVLRSSYGPYRRKTNTN